MNEMIKSITPHPIIQIFWMVDNEENESMRQFYHRVAPAAKNWKGENPVRRIDELAI